MRSHKHSMGVNPEGMSLTPMVNRYKLHLAAVKSLVPEKLQRTANLNDEADPRFCDPTVERNTSLARNFSKTDKRSAHGWRRLGTPSLLLLAGRCLDPVPGGAPDVQPNPSDKTRRPTQSAGCGKEGSTVHPPKHTGDWEEIDEGPLHGFPSTLFSREVLGSSSERIDLDRRCLDTCPQLGSVDGLRLLNLQHNRISRIQHVSHLQRLVFLDLYHNRISDMAGIEELHSLRVLMLGQNRIHKLSCLENLSRLEVLDLHANQSGEQEHLSVVGSPYWMAPEVLRWEAYNEKVDVFAFGIILCEVIARVQADPDFLPRTEDFGLDVDTFQHMVGDCPPDFLELAVTCCHMSAALRPSFSEIAAQLECREAETTPTDGPAAQCDTSTLPPAIGPLPRRGSLCPPTDARLSRSKSDVLCPPATPSAPGALATPSGRVNPFSQRKDLQGGKIKLFDTPSKSVISLTFALPPLLHDDPADAVGGAPARRHRRCLSLPCTPPPNLTSTPHPASTALADPRREPKEEEEEEAEERRRLVSDEEEVLLATKCTSDSVNDSGLPLPSETLTLELTDKEEEEEEEPMDCTSSPDTLVSAPAGRPATPSLPPTLPPFHGSWLSNGPKGGGLTLLPPAHDNNNVVVGRPLGWAPIVAPGNANGYRSPPPSYNGYDDEGYDPAGPSPFGSAGGHSPDQDEVISCPGCCLAGLRFPSLCLRASSAPPRRNPYKNLNGERGASTRGLLQAGPKGRSPPSSSSSSPAPTGTKRSPEPGLVLPGAQT